MSTTSNSTRRPLEVVGGLTPIATLAYDESFCIIDANEAAEKLLGRPRSEIVGQYGTAFVQAEEVASAASAVEVVNENQQRAFPAMVRLLHADGSAIPVTVHLRSLREIGVDGAHFIAALAPASLNVALDALVDSLVAGGGTSRLLMWAIAAAESTGHYAASIHHTAGFSGFGPLSEVSAGSISAVLDLHSARAESALSRTCTRAEPAHVSLDALGFEPELTHGDLRLRGCAVYPIIVKGCSAGVLAVWTEQPLALGPYGHIVMQRIASVTGLAVANELQLASTHSVRRVGALSIDLVERTVEVDGRRIRLTPIESTIMGLLSEVPGRPLTREQIVRQLFGSTHVGDGRACDMHIRNLRAKLGDDAGHSRFITTIRGVGYALQIG